MLYKYNFIENHPLGELNRHLNYFFYKIRRTQSNSSFRPVNYFHKDFMPIIENSPELKKKFKEFFNTYKKLDAANKLLFNKIIVSNLSIENSYEDINYCCLNFQSESLVRLLGNNSLQKLMSHLYNTTLKSSRYKIEEHYSLIYNSMPKKICPFCGVTKMHKTYQEDYDHLAPKSKYPLLAINIKNLAPMCHQCNSKFKNEVDIYYENNHRRPFAYPYVSAIDIDIDFTGSVIDQTDVNNLKGVWSIRITPSTPINKTWVDVFQIEKRYKEDYLEEDFNDWIDEFIESLVRDNVVLTNNNDVKAQLLLISKSFSNNKLNNCNIIKAPLFKFLAESKLDSFYDSIIFKYNNKKAA